MNLVQQLGSEHFLQHYWQRKPVLLRQALPNFQDPLSAEELAGLACETDVDSRLVHFRRQQWQLQQGPFSEATFTKLPANNWTLLVQAVDQWVPAVKELLKSLPFLPSWRVDDVMISYATPNGGVGPHFDYYDVFLLQGQGTRVWKTGQRCTSRDELRTSSGLKLLSKFHTEQEWEMHSGDVLYVPPGVAHWGTSLDNSLCYSLGFRAPSLADMLLGFGDAMADHLSPDQRFTDPRRPLPLQSGEIASADHRRVKQLLQRLLQDDAAIAAWFGKQMTEPRYPELSAPPKRPPRLLPSSQLHLHPASRLAWQQDGKQLQIFSNGDSARWPNTRKLRHCLSQLCAYNAISASAYLTERNCAAWLQQAVAAGYVVVQRRTAR